MFDQILAVLDDPEDLGLLLPLLRKFSASMGPRVSLMQSVPFLETLLEMPGELSPGTAGDDAEAAAYIAALAARLRTEGIAAEGFAEVGGSPLTIAAAAERVGASLILLATRRPG